MRQISPITEADIQKNVLEYLTAMGIKAWRNNSGRRGRVSYGHKGSGDIIGCLPNGRFLSIEIKKPGGSESKDQINFKEEIKKNNGLAIVVKSVKEVDEKIRLELIRQKSPLAGGPPFKEGKNKCKGILYGKPCHVNRKGLSNI